MRFWKTHPRSITRSYASEDGGNWFGDWLIKSKSQWENRTREQEVLTEHNVIDGSSWMRHFSTLYGLHTAAVIKNHKLRGLERHKCKVSQFWRLGSKVRLSPGVSRATVSVLALGTTLSCLSWLLVLADSPWQSVALRCTTQVTWPCSHGVFSHRFPSVWVPVFRSPPLKGHWLYLLAR